MVRWNLKLENYQVIIRDDGTGFDITGINGKEHFGLNIMRARAARLDGNLIVESAPGQGTRVILTWPARDTVG